MNKQKRIEIGAATLFITATVAYSIAVILFEPILTDSAYMLKVHENKNVMTTAALLVLVDSVAVAAIGIVLYPVLKTHSESLALGYAGARMIECMLFVVNVIAMLSLVSLSQEYANLGSQSSPVYQSLGAVLMAAANWAYLFGLGLAFALSALILNFLLYQSRLIPRWLSAWGFIAALLVFVNFVLETCSINPFEVLFFPIAIQEMVFAVWLIIRGFDLAANSTVELGKA